MNLSCVIVETRNRPNLEKIIADHLRFLPEGITLYIFGGESTEYLKDKFDCIFMQTKIKSIRDYNVLLLSDQFWANFNEDRILIFQHDSGLLRKGIEEFLEWDYIGAAWTGRKNPQVGNGGLSLRNPKAMRECIRGNRPNPRINEDIFFSGAIYKNQNFSLPGVEVADRFSVESRFILNSMGYHAIDKLLTPKQCKLIRNQYLIDSNTINRNIKAKLD